MQVVVLYFAALREHLALSEERYDVPQSSLSVRDFTGHLIARHPTLQGRLDCVRFALNETFAALDEPIHDGDTVALIPPVAGG
jgi:molybdopterin converting factor subunit 1